MRKKKKKLIKSILSVVGVVALFFLVSVLVISLWGFIRENALMVGLVSGGVLFVLFLLGIVKGKTIKRKIIDIFT